jgi:hypothetical protein
VSSRTETMNSIPGEVSWYTNRLWLVSGDTNQGDGEPSSEHAAQLRAAKNICVHPSRAAIIIPVHLLQNRSVKICAIRAICVPSFYAISVIQSGTSWTLAPMAAGWLAYPKNKRALAFAKAPCNNYGSRSEATSRPDCKSRLQRRERRV